MDGTLNWLSSCSGALFNTASCLSHFFGSSSRNTFVNVIPFVVGVTPSVLISFIFSVNDKIFVNCVLYICASSSLIASRARSAVRNTSSFVIFAISFTSNNIYSQSFSYVLFQSNFPYYKSYNTLDNIRKACLLATNRVSHFSENYT